MVCERSSVLRYTYIAYLVYVCVSFSVMSWILTLYSAVSGYRHFGGKC
jgi:hypothetical protein